jgi:hypothetical protein
LRARIAEADWSIASEVFDAAQSCSGAPGHDDRKLLEALHYFTADTVKWRTLTARFGNRASVWNRSDAPAYSTLFFNS